MHWFQEAFNCTIILIVETHAELVVGKVFEGKPLLLLLTEFIINRNKIPHCIHWHSNNTSLSDNFVQWKPSQTWDFCNIWRVKIHQKFETCCIKTIGNGFHLLLNQYILKVHALFQMLFRVLFLVMTSTICAGLRYYF